MRLNLRQASGAFIDGFADWTHFVTLTYPLDVSRADLNRHYDLVRDHVTAMGNGEHVAIARAVGPQQRGTQHLHILIALPASSQGDATRLMPRFWRHLNGGNAKACRYSPTRDAGAYLVRHDQWEVDYACPRTGRCARARSCTLVSTPIPRM